MRKYILTAILLVLTMFSASCGKKEAEFSVYDEDDQEFIAEEEIFEDEEKEEEEEETVEVINAASDEEEKVYGMTLSELRNKFIEGYTGKAEDGSQITLSFTEDKSEAFYATESADATKIVHALGLCATEGEDGYSITDSSSLEIVRFTMGEDEKGNKTVTTPEGVIYNVERAVTENTCIDFMAAVKAGN
ncbi:MAG: hypothetical protein K6F99_05900 [Lachnospiraceae bacterium]|nr:hypothetical protein [Lachnospiraceae bacterium]